MAAAFKRLKTSAVETLIRGLTRIAGGGATPGAGVTRSPRPRIQAALIEQADRHVGAHGGGAFDEAFGGGSLPGVSAQQNAYGSGGVG